MKTLATLIFILLGGCAQFPQPPDAKPNCMTGDLWTNYWTLKVIVSPNIEAPRAPYQSIPAVQFSP